MATIQKELLLNASAEVVWDAVRDFQGLHKRLVTGFVVDVKAEDGARVITFANGMVTRELLVTCDDAARRLVYAAVSEHLKHHNASVSVLPEPGGRSRLVWTTDVLPDAIAGYMDAQIQKAASVMQKAFDGTQTA